MINPVARNSLRPVTVNQFNKESKGYFHGFIQEGNTEHGMYANAIIEMEDGSVTVVDAHRVKFKDVEGMRE